MKPEIFIVCTTDSMILSFLLPYIEEFKKNGFDVKCVASRTGDHFEKLEALGVSITEVPFTRNPFTLSNVKAYKKLKKILKKSNAKMIFCHEPVGGVMGRLVAKSMKIPVIYMAHGFHFYKGAHWINWFMFYPIEKVMSYITDVLITINSEDYEFAKKKMKAKNIKLLSGVGVNINKYDSEQYDRNAKRAELGIPDEAVVLISVGELNTNKNHRAILEALNESKLENVYYIIAGVGEQDKELEQLASKYNIKLMLLGYRRDCSELYAASDVFCFPSYREGLSVALMEAMASGLPIIASEIRGNVDLIDLNGGILTAPDNIEDIKKALLKMCSSEDVRKKYGSYNKIKVQNYSVELVLPQFMELVGEMKVGDI